ncbi:DUF86 domain-containing protein [Pontibacillus yanchengensis]|uniref:DUF86 domain-containing protein n=1 Tax=Pontibacillus yanchengensis Y32 TaxID=1385514 RepID=A0A0A2TNB8_9BACI|nr:DUF86 domain-containing protein [Pontibacillus yanchengensis]KGP70825.1 hypothetical protein N782_02805 [Pontibacillus yanchengensis Y32]
MYFVDRSKIESTLQYMEQLLKHYQDETVDTPMKRLGLERCVQMTIESIVDVGNMMIDGFIMRDPGSYDDIIDILIDESVIPEEQEQAYKSVISVRKQLVRDYTNMDHDQLQNMMNEHITILHDFSDHIRRYLNEELGPISAFSNEDQ